MPRLLQINSFCNFGSTGHIVEDIAQLGIKKGWECYVAAGRGNFNTESHLIKIGNKSDILIHGLKTRFFDQHGLGSIWATHKLIKDIKRIKPDIIHLHNIHGYYLNYPILFRYLANLNIPIVWTLHDCWTFTGHCTYYSNINCNKWMTGCYQCPQKNTYPRTTMIDRSKQNWLDKKKAFTSINNLTIITVSDWLKENVKKSFLKNYNIRRIYNGINTEIFKPQSDFNSIIEKYRLDNSKFHILGVASVWDERKGLNEFIQLRHKLPNNYEIILVGLNDKQISSLPLGIKGIKRTENQKELAALYSFANVFINASHEETLGLTTIESLACGTPAIVHNTTACPEVIDEKTGYTLITNNLNEIIERIEEIKKNSKIQYSDYCRKRVINYFRKNDKYEEYFQLYENLLSSNENS